MEGTILDKPEIEIFLKELTEKERESFMQTVRSFSYKKGQVLFYDQDKRTTLYFLIKGTVKFELVDSTGEHLYLEWLKQKQLFPLIGLLQDTYYSFSAIAHTDVEVIRFSVSSYEELLARNQELLRMCMNQQSNWLKLYMKKLQKGVSCDTYTRVAITLASLYHTVGVKNRQLGCLITIKEIAKASGTTRETASSVLKRMKRNGKIDYRQKKLTFLDQEYFLALLEE